MKKTILTIVALFIAVAIGFIVGRITSSCNLPTVESKQSVTTTTQTETPVSATNSADTVPIQKPVTVNINSLSDGQRQLLKTLGIDADSITITPTMVACAEAKIGASRMQEIQDGATPTFFEGLDLIACYK